MKRISIILIIIILIPVTTAAGKSADPVLVYDVTLNGLVKVVDRKLLFILMPDKSVYRINYEEDNGSTENAELEKLESEWEIFINNVTIYNMDNTSYYIWRNGRSRDDVPIWQITLMYGDNAMTAYYAVTMVRKPGFKVENWEEFK